ncbi:MAG: 50S ribosomal protein L13 [Candidatus Thermoplasmatota archaeon]
MTAIIDATDKVMGRLATFVTKKLLDGEKVVVVNSEKAIITGKKKKIKNRYREKREVGTYRKGPYFPRTSDKILKRTIRGMMPYQKPYGRKAFKRLKCYIGIPEEIEDKNFEELKDIEKKPLNYITLEELSKSLGARI